MEKIKWKLLDNDNITLTGTGNIENNIISFNFDNSTNIIDISKSIYEREVDDYKMILNFNINVLEFRFIKEGNCAIDVECEFKIDNSKYYLEYKIDDIKKTIIIERI